ncbi:ABC transporter ATP-binding protein [Streptomyces sp. CBMA29]|uniref:ABC transporter ATP-binding protein n=1 Tax=Streptomyces sp. CBMA29 TaxID=1896314 RepID=UPI001661D5E0|nr:ABC transporter ATP-binding protein [Streptomyces sp. CBMA29]MBD0739252.1 ABC transporter ATP-binding protein [Streptomyces sp. CBMA29]
MKATAPAATAPGSAGPSSAALELDGLTAGHGQAPAVRELDLRVAAGEIVALLGPNGAGKTTTLDTVCGVLPPLAGQVNVFGHPVRDLRQAARQRIAYVPEHRGLFRDLTVEENLRLRARTRRKVQAVYDRFDVLGALRDRQTGLLSGGEQQLLALVCALSLDARLLLIDEMTMGLAPMVVSGLVDIVKEVAAEGVAVLFVEQHLHIALELCDRAYVLSHGRCVREGTGGELRHRVDELASLYFAGDPSLGR